MAKRDRKALLIRIPTATYKAVKKQAKENNRTVTAHINEILQAITLPMNATTGNIDPLSVTLLNK